MKRMDLTRLADQMIVSGLSWLVEKDGLSPIEAFDVLEDIKRNTFHSLNQIKREVNHETSR